MKIDTYNFELYRFKVGAFFSETVYFFKSTRIIPSGKCGQIRLSTAKRSS